MRFTRRRWDLWCLGGALFLALGGLADTLLLGSPWWKPLQFTLPILVFVAWRFGIPVDGFPATPIRRLPPASRRLLLWCVGSLPLLPVAGIALSRAPWWTAPIAAALHVAFTLRLARRADLERGLR